MNAHEILKDLNYRINRIAYYNEKYTDWLEFLIDLKGDIECLEESHDDCYSEDQLHRHVSDETEELREENEKLKAKLKKKSISKTKQALQDRIEELEGELSDAKADLNVYRERIEKGATPAKLADMFIFTPEDARAQFRLIIGGAA